MSRDRILQSFQDGLFGGQQGGELHGRVEDHAKCLQQKVSLRDEAPKAVMMKVGQDHTYPEAEMAQFLNSFRLPATEKDEASAHRDRVEVDKFLLLEEISQV